MSAVIELRARSVRVACVHAGVIAALKGFRASSGFSLKHRGSPSGRAAGAANAALVNGRKREKADAASKERSAAAAHSAQIKEA